jgi:hypothetical protein
MSIFLAIRHLNIISDPVNGLLSTSCRCLPGLRTIVLVIASSTLGCYNSWNPVTVAAKHLLEAESRIEWITLSGGIRRLRIGRDTTCLRTCIEVKRHEDGQGLYYVYREINISPISTDTTG